MGWIRSLSPTMPLACVTGPVLDPHGEFHFVDGRLEVSPNVGGKCLERRNVERVQAAFFAVSKVQKAWKKPGQSLSARPWARSSAARTRQRAGAFRPDGAESTSPLSQTILRTAREARTASPPSVSTKKSWASRHRNIAESLLRGQGFPTPWLPPSEPLGIFGVELKLRFQQGRSRTPPGTGSGDLA